MIIPSISSGLPGRAGFVDNGRTMNWSIALATALVLKS
jgi:hypothetical protein